MRSVTVKTERKTPAKQMPLTVATGFVNRFASAETIMIRQTIESPIGQ